MQICIGSKFGHEVSPLALVFKVVHQVASCIATVPLIALFALSVGIDLVSSSARITSVKSQKGVSVTDNRTQRTPGLPGSDIKDVKQKITWMLT